LPNNTLKSLLEVSDLGPGAEVTIPHNLHRFGVSQIPDHVGRDNASLEVLESDVTATDVTVRNTSDLPQSGRILCELWHSVERAFGARQVTEISPPFIPAAGGMADIEYGDPITVRGPTNAEGDEDKVARSNHDHRLEYEVEDEGVLVSARPRMDFVGDGVGAIDDALADKTIVTIPGPELADGGAVVKRSQFTDPAGGSSTSALVFVDGMAGTFVTIPIDGDYLALFEAEAENQSASARIEIGISVDSVVAVVANSERDSQGPAADKRPVITSVQLPGLTAGQLVRALFRKVAGAGTVTLYARHLILIKVQ
jgi:hypothetical protein